MNQTLSDKKVWFAVFVAAALWFVMFSPWTASSINFWYTMTAAGAILTTLSFFFYQDLRKDLHITWKGALTGLGIAVGLWCVFWVAKHLAYWMFDFAPDQVGAIYAMKGSTSPKVIALLLLLIIGPAEEIFWRGYVQRQLMSKWNANLGFIVATLLYALVHIWSFNFILIMAALVVGACWGLLYRLFPKALFPLIVSHALWDVAAFVLFPF